MQKSQPCEFSVSGNKPDCKELHLLASAGLNVPLGFVAFCDKTQLFCSCFPVQPFTLNVPAALGYLERVGNLPGTWLSKDVNIVVWI